MILYISICFPFAQGSENVKKQSTEIVTTMDNPQPMHLQLISFNMSQSIDKEIQKKIQIQN